MCFHISHIEIILAKLTTVFLKMVIENTVRSSVIMAVEVSEGNFRKRQVVKQRH